MKLYLMRHGQAVSEEVDPERPLSDEGRERVKASAAAIRALGLTFDLIVASPKARSRQTAETVAAAVAYPVEAITITDAVKPSAPPRDALKFLAEQKGRQSILIAGHLPSLEQIAGALLTPKGGLAIHFDCGGLACIEAEAPLKGGGALLFHLTPDQLARLAGRGFSRP